MYNDIPGRYRMFLSVWCHLPGPLVLLFMGPGPALATPMPAQRLGAGFVWLCLVTFNNCLAIACCQAGWERMVCLESGDGRQVHVVEGGLLDWQWPCGRNHCLCVCVHMCVSVYVCGSVWGIILENLSLWRGTDVDLHMWRVPSLWWD